MFKLFSVISLLFFAASSLSEAAPSNASETRILVLGDSLTEGLNLPKNAAFPALVEKSLQSKGRQVEVINAGISGSTSASGPSRLKWHLKGGSKPKILVLALGANDGLRGLEITSTRKNLEEVITAAKSQEIKVLLAGMKLPPNYGKKYADEFEAMFKDLAAKHHLGLIPFLLEGVGGVSSLNLPDGIHPNEEGHKIVAKTVLKYLEPLL